MDLVNEYLRVVAALLPKSQQDDIIAELRDTILTRIETGESELGRPFTEAETEALLREIGHPLVVAARYREGPQHVVGPALYPYWFFAVKIALTIQVAIAVVILLAKLIGGVEFGQALGQAIGSALTGAITLVGFATIAAWIIERQKIHIGYLDGWRVRDLRVLEFAAWDWDALRERMEGKRPLPAARMRKPLSACGRHVSSIGGGLCLVAIGTVFLLWWVGVLRFDLIGDISDLRKLALEPGALEAVDWAGIRQILFWPVVAYGAVIILKGMVMVGYPHAVWLRGLTNIAQGALAFGICAWLWSMVPSLAPGVQADSVSAFVVLIKTTFQNSPPLLLAPVLMLTLAIVAISAICRVLQGLWELATPSRKENVAQAPAI